MSALQHMADRSRGRYLIGAAAVICLLTTAGCSRSQAGTPSAGSGDVLTATTVGGTSAGTTASASQSVKPSPTSNGSGAGSGTAAELTAATVQDLVLRPLQSETDDFWEEVFRRAGLSDSVSAAMEFVAAGDGIECEGKPFPVDDKNVGPAYCPENDHILVSDAFVAALGSSRMLRADGSFVDPAEEVGLYFLIAHEWGHNVIAELAQDRNLTLAGVPEMELENLADCFAGMAIAGVPHVFSEKDPDSILGSAESLDEPYGGRHGTAEQRREAIATGLDNPYEDRQGFADTLDRCLKTYAPSLGEA
jgi:predicted metalloprotease